MLRAKSKTDVNSPVGLPAGVCIVTEKGRFYLNRDGKRYKIISDRVFNSWKFPTVVKLRESQVKHYPVAVTRLKFRDGTVIVDFGTKQTYYIEAGKKRLITNPDTIKLLGIKRPIGVSSKEAQLMPLGEPIL